MDELQLIERFRAEVPEPDPTTVARARGVLLSALEGEGSPEPRRLRFPARQPLALLAALTAAGLTLALLVPVLLPAGRRPEAAAAEFLRNQARIATDQPALWPVPSGQYLYQERIEWKQSCLPSEDDSTWNCTTPGTGAFTHRIWIAPDGSGHECFIGLEGSAAQPCGDVPAGMLGTPMDLSNLPTDPNELLAEAEAGTLPGDRVDDQGQVVDAAAGLLGLLSQPGASPALRAGLYEAAAMIPGIELVGGVKDEIGRDGIGIAYMLGGGQSGTRLEVIFDPQNSDLLEEKMERVAAGLEDASGTPLGGAPLGVTGWVIYKTTAVVDAIGDRL
jgi:hypothetical protein